MVTRSVTGNRGSALLTVLWLTAALSAIGFAVATNVRGETERTSTSVDDTKSWFVARGAIEQAALHILWRDYRDSSNQPLYYRSGQPAMNLDFPTAQVTVRIIPETAKLNPNTIRPEDLLRLLMALGLPEDRATELAAAIVDWRTPVTPNQPSAFDAFYLAQTPSFLPRHASFLENEELLLIKGMTPGIYYGESLGESYGESLNNSRAGLRDCLSIYGSYGAVDINSAEPATLQAVGLSPDDARAIVQRRAVQPFDTYAALGDVQKELGPVGTRLSLGGQTMFTLRATARLKQPDGRLSDLRRTVAALVQFTFPGNTKNKATGYQVIRWFERP
jgi:general secretion pathway protein K